MPPFAVIDIGTNSIRLGIVQPEPGLSYNVLSLQKEVVRLGEGEFATNNLTPAAIDRGLQVLSRFAEMARGFGAETIACVATSALREAANQSEFVERAGEEAGVEVRIVSGAEEARLIFLGVASGLDLGGARVMVIDLGGGSTELVVGSAEGPELLESLKLGAIRVAGIFTEGETGPISPQLYRRIQEYARGVAVHSLARVREHGFERVYGSSGTILNLADVAARAKGESMPPGRSHYVTTAELEQQGVRLAALTLEQRRRVPGLNPERADIIVAGAAVLATLLRQVGAAGLHTSDLTLREGVIVDHLQRCCADAAGRAESIRDRSVLQLARRCQFEEAHARVVASLACSLFDQFRELGLHSYGPAERELLVHAALLHDIGGFISYADHQRHGYYLVRHSPLLGFDGTETQMLAAIVLHHRKGLPRRKDEAVADLGRRQREVVTVLAAIVRLAEAMDRGHLGSVTGVRCAAGDRGRTVALELLSETDCQLELWGLANHREVFQEVFGRKLSARCAGSGELEAAPAD